jgi:hypothetical protein
MPRSPITRVPTRDVAPARRPATAPGAARRRALQAAAIATALACAPGPAAAQSGPPAPGGGASAAHASPERLGTVTVSAGAGDPAGTTDAASSGSVSGERLLARPLLRPADVLEWVPGMVVTQHSGDGKANQYFLRGFNLDHGTDFATSVAGVPVNLGTHAHGHGYTDLNFLVPELVERVDYRKGPYSAMDGDFASAGAADIRLRSRLDGPVGQLTAGSNGYRRLFGAAAPQGGAGHLLLGFETLGNDGPWEVAQDARRVNVVARYGAGTARDGHELTLMGYDARWTATDQVPQRAIESGAIGRFGSLDPTSGGDSSRLSLSGGWRRPLADGRIEASAWVLRYRLNLFSNFTYALERPDTGDQIEQADRRTAAGLRVARSWNTIALGVPSLTTVGVQARQDRIEVGLYDTQARERLATVRADRVDATSAGVFGEHVSFWSDRLRTVAGLRLDGVHHRVDADLPANGGARSEALASPKLSVVLTPLPALEAFAGVGRGFHSNDARGTLTRIDPRTGEAVVPVQPLVPTTGSELGLRWAPAPTLRASLAYWWLRIGSELVFVGDAGTTEPSRASRRRGLELNARWMPQPWLGLDLDVAQSRARFSDDDPAGPFIPGSVSQVASVGMSVQGAGRWSGGLRVRYIGARPLTEDGSVRSSPSAIADLRIGWRVAPRTDLLLDVFNVGGRAANDIEYFYASRLRGEAGPVEDIHLHPAEPRTVRLSLRLGF